MSDVTLLPHPRICNLATLDVNGGVQNVRNRENMKKLIIAGALVAATLASPAIALAGSDNQLAPGTPGEANCAGQTRAYVTQGNFNDIIGLGNQTASMKEVQRLVNLYC